METKIGTAGWSIARQIAPQFETEGTGLRRYASRFTAVEINSSFHRPHRLTTWQRWSDSVPEDFRFSVKLPKLITHQRKLADCTAELDEFIAQAGGLGDKLAVLLVQLPPSLALDETVATAFFAALADRSPAAVACEPRHPSWFEARAGALLDGLKVARVAADPAICAPAAEPGGWPGLAYWRLHGSPVVYRSSYADRIDGYTSRISRFAAEARQVWCVFDNTASSAAAGDALALVAAVARLEPPDSINRPAPL